MNPLITPNQLEELVNTGADILICDCRFDLVNPDAGRAALLARGVNEVGPYQSPMEDGMQHFHEWYRQRMEAAFKG